MKIMTVRDLIKKAQESDHLPKGARLPRATLRVGSADKRIAKLDPVRGVELSPDDIEGLADESNS